MRDPNPLVARVRSGDHRRAKIVCTLGLATASSERITELLGAGMDIARLNVSHGHRGDHEHVYRAVRQAACDTGRTVGILADLQRPKIRLGRFAAGPVEWRPGAPLGLGLLLAEDDGSPVCDAMVGVWQCDAAGRYSGFPPPTSSALAPNRTPAGPQYVHDCSFLRGCQTTDTAGMVEFRTIYPGWYPGRTAHIHLMVSSPGRVLTSQLYFPDPLTDTVHALPPYNQRPGRDTTNDTDVIFPMGGEPAVLQLRATTNGYLGSVRLHLPGS